MFDDVFKDDLTPTDRLDIPLVKIPFVSHLEDVTPYNSKIPIDTPRFHESAARKELGRILRSWALEEVHQPTPWFSYAFFVQKPGSTDDDPSVRLVTNLKPVNKVVDNVGYPMDGSSHILRRLEPDETCFAVVNLVQGFHQILLYPDSRDS